MENPVPQQLRVPRRLTVSQEQLLVDGARCWECPLGSGGVPSRPVPTDWVHAAHGFSPILALVGEAPGRREVMLTRVFIGPSGKMLNQALASSGIPRSGLAILNAAACGPIPSGADSIKVAAVAACRPRLISELRRLRPRAILALGASALKTLAPSLPSGVTVLRGAQLEIDRDVLGEAARDAPLLQTTDGPRAPVAAPGGRAETPGWSPAFFATFHPAHILRGGDGEADDANPSGDGGRSVDLLYFFFLYDLVKAWRFARGEIAPWRDECDLFVHDGKGLRRVTVDEKGLPVLGEDATPREFEDAMLRVSSEAAHRRQAATDVETDSKDSLAANLTAISVATVDGGLAATWDAWRSVPRALACYAALLADRTMSIVMHNRIYDSTVLPRHGLPIRARIDCTLLKHHAAFPGLPHALDQVVTQLCLAPPWKAEFRKSTRHLPELILYSFRDSYATALVSAPLDNVIRANRTERVYEVDRQLSAVATYMRGIGFWVDRVEQARQSSIQHARLDYMQGELTRQFDAVEEKWRGILARNLAVKQRKKDPDSYTERVAMRYRQIAEREHKPSDVGLFKPKAKADLVALFEALGIPFTDWTEKGAPKTDKRAMEVASARHPLMRQLIHLREAQHVLATYIDGLPIKADGRVHPDWSIVKISGRWGAGKSQNVPKQVPSWPPEVDEAGVWKRKASGDYITSTENARALVTAPTVGEILSMGLRLVAPPVGALPTTTPEVHARAIDQATPVGCTLAEQQATPDETTRAIVDAPPGSATRAVSLTPPVWMTLAEAHTTPVSDTLAGSVTAPVHQSLATIAASSVPDTRAIRDAPPIRAALAGRSPSPDGPPLAEFLSAPVDRTRADSPAAPDDATRAEPQASSETTTLAGLPTTPIERSLAVACTSPDMRTLAANVASPVVDTRVDAVASPVPVARAACNVTPVLLSLAEPSAPPAVPARVAATATPVLPALAVPAAAPVLAALAGPTAAPEAQTRAVAVASPVAPTLAMPSATPVSPSRAALPATPADQTRLVHPLIFARALAGHGRMLFGADSEQVELRIAAQLSGDEFLLDIFARNLDPHAEFARIGFGERFITLEATLKALGVKPKDTDSTKAKIATATNDIEREKQKQVLRDQLQWAQLRDLSKRAEYGAVYRGGWETLYENIVKEFPQAQPSAIKELHRVINEKLAGLNAWHNRMETEVRLTRAVRERLFGRMRCFPLGNYDPSIVVNFPIQSFNSSLLAKAIFRFVALTHPELLDFEGLYKFGLLDAAWVGERRAEGYGEWRAPCDLTHNGHDSLTGECDEEDAPRAAKLLELSMDQTVTLDGVTMRYPAKADIGRRWSEV